MKNFQLLEKYCNRVFDTVGCITEFKFIDNMSYYVIFNFLDIKNDIIPRFLIDRGWVIQTSMMMNIKSNMRYFEYECKGVITLEEVEKYFAVEFRKKKIEKIISEIKH